MTAYPNVLAVCSGNICRSPLAEYYLRAWVARACMPVRVASAGTLGIVGAPAAPKMVTVSREIDVDLTPHRSQAVTAELVAGADFVLCMELEHAMHVRGLHPTASEHQIVMLGAYGGPGTISDPIRAWTTGPFRATRDLITLCIDNWARHVLQDYEPR